MRAVVQRVTEARVRVDEEVVGSIGPGLCVLVGVTHSDGKAEAERLAAKVHDLRILAGERSAAEAEAPLLVISQFTLYVTRARAGARAGRPPHLASSPSRS